VSTTLCLLHSFAIDSSLSPRLQWLVLVDSPVGHHTASAHEDGGVAGRATHVAVCSV
jgi:hypothetical protein